MRLYHTSLNIIKNPDLTFGRKNADFGQGFYLSPDIEFSYKWAKSYVDEASYINIYELDTSNLKIKEFKRKDEWLNYIFKNRNNFEDEYSEFDIIIGPIANDTLFNLWGILTSNLVDRKKCLEVLLNGPVYNQVVIKSNKAKFALKYINSEVIDKDIIIKYHNEMKKEEEKYQKLTVKILGKNIKKLLS